MKTTSTKKAEPVFIGIDYHKRYSVYYAVGGRGEILARGRIEHERPQGFVELVKRWPGCRVVFEASMNWQWLYEVLETAMDAGNIVLANPCKTRIIAEAQVKTDKDAHILAQLLRADLVSSSHIASKPTRERKEVLRQRCFFCEAAHDAAQPHPPASGNPTRTADAAVKMVIKSKKGQSVKRVSPCIRADLQSFPPFALRSNSFTRTWPQERPAVSLFP